MGDSPSPDVRGPLVNAERPAIEIYLVLAVVVAVAVQDSSIAQLEK